MHESIDFRVQPPHPGFNLGLLLRRRSGVDDGAVVLVEAGLADREDVDMMVSSLCCCLWRMDMYDCIEKCEAVVSCGLHSWLGQAGRREFVYPRSMVYLFDRLSEKKDTEGCMIVRMRCGGG